MMEVSKKSITRATRLSTDGERWSKHKTITKEQWQRLLKPQFQNVKLTMVVHRSYIKEDWKKVLLVLHNISQGKDGMDLLINTTFDFFFTSKRN